MQEDVSDCSLKEDTNLVDPKGRVFQVITRPLGSHTSAKIFEKEIPLILGISFQEEQAMKLCFGPKSTLQIQKQLEK
jgi:hypothetical protein